MYPGAPNFLLNLKSIPTEVFTVGHGGLAHSDPTQGAGTVDGQDAWRKASTKEALSTLGANSYEGFRYCGDRDDKNSSIKTMLAIKDKNVYKYYFRFSPLGCSQVLFLEHLYWLKRVPPPPACCFLCECSLADFQ